ncbi:MAG: hypothetical protein FJ207_00590 [Gemmatimonadetes bacterium]|nr:hypothetical protein [Gemmatimonadota bacterium]
MREFTDAEGRRWRASPRQDDSKGVDYKGRLFLVLERADGPGGEAYALPEVRWNSERTAERTISTMSAVELRRRLRSALGRGEGRLAG